MSIGRFFSLLIAVTVSGLAYAEPLPVLSQFQRVNMGPGCNIRAAIPKDAEFPVTYSAESGHGGGSVIVRKLPKVFRGNTFYFGFICYVDDDGFVTQGWATYNADTESWSPHLDQEEERQLKGAFKFYPLKTVNAEGWAVTVNDTIGDENIRQRTLYYCVLRHPKAVCGDGKVGYLKDGRKGDLTDYALKILRSIEFLEDAEPGGREQGATANPPP